VKLKSYHNSEKRVIAFFANEGNLSKYPAMEIIRVFRDGTEISAIINSGSQVNLLA
jgi:hypothetical protein